MASTVESGGEAKSPSTPSLQLAQGGVELTGEKPKIDLNEALDAVRSANPNESLAIREPSALETCWRTVRLLRDFNAPSCQTIKVISTEVVEEPEWAGDGKVNLSRARWVERWTVDFDGKSTACRITLHPDGRSSTVDFKVEPARSSSAAQTGDGIAGLAKSFPAGPDWPTYAGELYGSSGLLIENPQEFDVKVGLRSNGKGRDFMVPADDQRTVSIPPGRYEIYFRYKSDPNGLYRGDDFAIGPERSRVTTITLTKSPDGNYPIRKIK